MVIDGVGLDGDADLVEVAHAPDGVGLFAGFVEGGEEDGNEEGDDADDNEQFDECKYSGGGCVTARHAWTSVEIGRQSTPEN